MTVVDHPLRQISELNLRISTEMGALACWKTDLLWDSYLTLEFGARQTLIGKHGPVSMGEFRVLLDEVAWWVQRDGKVVLDCDDVLANLDRSDLDEAFIGRKLVRLDWREQLSAIFSDRIAVVFERPEETSEQALDLRFANGDCVNPYTDGAIEIESVSE